MLERVRESLKILWRLFLLFLVFMPSCILIVIAASASLVITGVIITVTVPCAIIESMMMFVWWVITGRTWKDDAEMVINRPLWSFGLWERWVETVNYAIEKLL